MDTIEKLYVYMGEYFIGILSKDHTKKKGMLSFKYDKSYMEMDNGLPLSVGLPLSDRAFSHNRTENYFSGLLPEGNTRFNLCKHYNISEKNIFGLLCHIGGECAGAVSLYTDKESVKKSLRFSIEDYKPLSEDVFGSLLENTVTFAVAGNTNNYRLSTAGVQDKVALAFINGKPYLPMNEAISTHIIKPAIKGINGIYDTVLNEYFCMKLAKMVGFNVPEVFLYFNKNIAYYCIERYDRVIKNGNAIRLHQLDFCQILNIPSEKKYQNEGGVSLKDCFEIIENHSYKALLNKKNLLEVFLFNFAIGNRDAHGKNFSMLYTGNGNKTMELAPFYDILSTSVYGDIFGNKMAMSVDKKYDAKTVFRRHWEKELNVINIKAGYLDKIRNDLFLKMEKEGESLKNTLNNNPKTKSPVYDIILSQIRLQIATSDI